MFKISIPRPCNEDWNAMTPNEQGRHCKACDTTVVDFTAMTDEAVKHFFLNKKEYRVCGRFRNQQLQRIKIELPNNIFHIEMPVWKRFLLASLIVFSSTLFSCDTFVNGKPEVRRGRTTGIALPVETVKNDSTGVNDTGTIQLAPQNFVSTVTVQDIGFTTGITACPIPGVEVITKGEIEVVDTLPIETKAPIEIGQVLINEADSIKTKNPPKADSVNCNTQKFY